MQNLQVRRTQTRDAGKGRPALYYDYDLQVWVKGNHILDCHHPFDFGPDCCNQRRYACCWIWEARKAAGFTPEPLPTSYWAVEQGVIDAA